MENTQLRKLIDEPSVLVSNLVSARVIFDKQSPYLNSFVINTGSNKGIKNGMAVLDGENFIGRVVDVNFFSSRVADIMIHFKGFLFLRLFIISGINPINISLLGDL